MRAINKKALELLKAAEGCCLLAYPDAAGIWTIGFGHTNKVKKGMHITKEQAEKFLLEDLEVAQKAVELLVKVKLTDNQFGALVSFVFNVGVTAFANSTLLKILNEGRYLAAADQLLRWDKAGGHALAGLGRRRQRERALFLEA